MSEKPKKKVLVFGVFDGIHPGHSHMLAQAARLGTVAVAIARDRVAASLKNKSPRRSERARAAAIRNLGYDAVLGDREAGTYGVVKKLKPDIIALGYDQSALYKDLLGRFPDVKIVKLPPYKPDVYHTSLICKRK